jgi:type IV pilus assembly protein PilX
MNIGSINFEVGIASTNGGKDCACSVDRYQHGAVLIMSLVILMILTLLGITAMSTSSLQEKMSGNAQETTRAFEAAESGLNQALNTSGVLNLNGSTTNNFSYDSGKSGSASVVTAFVEYTPPKRGSGYGNNFQAANFDQSSTGTTTVGAKAVVHQGVAQIVPSSN